MAGRGVERGKKPPAPTNPEAEAYKKWVEREANMRRGAAFEKTPDQKYWEQWKKDHTPEGLSDYMEYKNPQGNRGVEKTGDKHYQEKAKWEQFETDTFGGTLESGKGSGEEGRYTVDDLYIKTSDKRWEDSQRDIYIDPKKKKNQQGISGGKGGKKGGGRKTGGQTGGPGNPNTGGGGAGDANL
tara:strand:+ start:22 stop:573 length:552 start_codon:yes stop_codon:yes gene_type:complete